MTIVPVSHASAADHLAAVRFLRPEVSVTPAPRLSVFPSLRFARTLSSTAVPSDALLFIAIARPHGA
jgi:hypothetical protein